MTRLDAAVGSLVPVPLLLAGSALVGAAIALHQMALLGIVGALALTVYVLFALPPRLLATLAVVVVLVDTSMFPLLTSVSDIEISLAEALLVVIIITCVLRGRRVPEYDIYWWLLLFIGWGQARSFLDFPASTVAFLKLAEPLVLSLAVARLVDTEFDLWRVVRWFGVVTVVTAPFYTDDLLLRWSSVVGGPNQLGLMAAVLLVLSLAQPASRSRSLQIVVAAAGLLVSASITSALAATAGVVAVGWWVPKSARSRRALSPAALIIAVPLLLVIVAVFRPDVALTISIHSGQAFGIGPALTVINPVLGGGWTFSAAYVDSLGLPFATLHNVYLQVLADLGLVGLGCFIGVLVVAFRGSTSSRTKAVLVVVAIWINSAGAFPGTPWGLLAIALLAARLEWLHQTRTAALAVAP